MRQTPTTRNSTTAVAVKRRSLPVADFVILVLIVVALFASASGCKALYYDESAPNLQGQPAIENPMLVPMLDRWYVMDQVSNELDDYFKIYREERIRILDGIMSEGWIETHPEIGATLLEPWHEDSTAGFERIHATLQSVRRFAKVRVIPMEKRVSNRCEGIQRIGRPPATDRIRDRWSASSSRQCVGRELRRFPRCSTQRQLDPNGQGLFA